MAAVFTKGAPDANVLKNSDEPRCTLVPVAVEDIEWEGGGDSETPWCRR